MLCVCSITDAYKYPVDYYSVVEAGDHKGPPHGWGWVPSATRATIKAHPTPRQPPSPLREGVAGVHKGWEVPLGEGGVKPAVSLTCRI